MSSQHTASVCAEAVRLASPTTARTWFATPEAFAALCVAARENAHARSAPRSEFDQQLAAQARFRQLRHGLDAPLRASELQHLCRIAGVPVPPRQGTLASMLAEIDTPLLRSLHAGYRRVATRDALRTAALIREELETRGEVLS